MPIYEFYSPDTNKIYSFYARSLAYAGKTPRCPDGAQYRMQKLISPFAVIGRAREPGTETDTAADADDARFEAAMNTMEREFASMDPDHPDPRQLARMMRRMSELTGEKFTPEMEEMARRLEAGEDPDKLDEEFADLDDTGMGEEDDESGGPSDTGSESEEKSSSRRLLRRLRRRRPPQRDETLYDMADYV